VTTNKGRKTPGVDGVLWKGARAKMQAVRHLRRHGYKPTPLRRIYIPKKNGKKRPLSIPAMYCRAMQALYKLALAPVAETTADPNSYGFREARGCADAIAQVFNALSKPNSATWVLEGDIKGCFDNISFRWLLENIPIDKDVLKNRLKAGYIDNDIKYPSLKGTPQGGIISPTLANMTLDGLEQVVHQAVPRRSRVNFVRYADDFIVTGKSKRILETKVKPAIESFLLERGLQLSPEKTKITYIRDGFTFLGQTCRKNGNTLHITPSKEGIKTIVRKVGTLIGKYQGAPIPALIKRLNQTLRGWGNYHRYVVSSEAFSYVDNYVYHKLWKMLKKRHRNKSKEWLKKHYWTAAKGRHQFSIKVKTKKKKPRVYQLFRLRQIGIKRYVKVRDKS
jgi:Retron-type reverse transcriptase